MSLSSPSPLRISPPGPRLALPGQNGSLTGTIIRERYELLNLLGSGGMAEVYEARFLPARHKRFALKLLRLDLCQDQALCKRFAHEFSILYEHQHDNLVAAHDYDRTKDGRLFIVLERLQGHSLDQLRGPLPPVRVVTIAKQLGSVLQHLHQASVLHRDLKPSNVILLDEPSPKKGRQRLDRIKLVDLGIARLLPGYYVEDRPYLTPPEERLLTETGLVLGTPRYMPPEAGNTKPSEVWDIYSLGVMLWRLACGRAPPNDWRNPGVMRAVPEGRFGLPKLMERMLRSAMSVDPEQRIPSAEEFLLTLMEVEAELTTSSHSVPVAAGAGAGAEVSTVENPRRLPGAHRHRPDQNPNPDKNRHRDHAQPAPVHPPEDRLHRFHWALLGLIVGITLGSVISIVVLRPAVQPANRVREPAPSLRHRPGEFRENPVAAATSKTLTEVAEAADLDPGRTEPSGGDAAKKGDRGQANPKRERSPRQTLNTWVRRHKDSIQRCFRSLHGSGVLEPIDITLEMDALGRLDTIRAHQEMPHLQRRCLRHSFEKLDVGRRCANCALELTLHPDTSAK